jgi:hypothetical protein
MQDARCKRATVRLEDSGREKGGEREIIMLIMFDYLQHLAMYMRPSTNAYDCQRVAKPIVSSSWL